MDNRKEKPKVQPKKTENGRLEKQIAEQGRTKIKEIKKTAMIEAEMSSGTSSYNQL